MTTAQAEKILKKVDTLPTLPAIAVQVLEMSLSEDTSTQDMVDSLKRDPALTTKILKVVNSAAFGLRSEVSSLPYAVTILGLHKIRRLVLSLSILDTLTKVGAKGQLDKMAFWRNSVATATAAKSLAIPVGRVNPEEAYVAGLIHDLGFLIMDTIVPEKFSKALKIMEEKGPDCMLDVERDILETTHAEIGAQLAERWKLPQPLYQAILHHHSPEECLDHSDPMTYRLVSVTAAAEFLSWSAGYSLFETTQPPTPGIPVIDLVSEIELAEQYQIIHEEVKKGSDIFRYTEDPSGERWQKLVLRANAELGRISAHLELANRGLTDLNTALLNAQHRLGERDPISSLLAEVVGTLGYDRSFLLGCEAKGTHQVLKVMSGDGSGTEWEGKTVQLAIDFPPNSREGKRVRKEDGAGGEAHILNAFQTEEMIVAPILENNAVRYLLAADRASSRQDIPREAEQILAQLTVQAGLLLENYRLYQKVQDMAVTDPLTGVCNRRRLMEVVSEEVDRALRTKRPISVAILDLDHFKKINDQLGHLTGDQVLKGVGELLRNSIRAGDCVGRYGGEEFLIVLPGADQEKALLAAERMRKSVEHFGEQSKTVLKGMPLSASFGIATISSQREGFEELLARADDALYKAKAGGRNQVIVAPEPEEEEPKG